MTLYKLFYDKSSHLRFSGIWKCVVRIIRIVVGVIEVKGEVEVVVVILTVFRHLD